MMALNCPACNKPDQTGPACQRCACDLAALHAIRRAADTCLHSARAAWREGQWDQALARAERAWELCHSVEAARCAFLAAGALGETSTALRWRQRALQPNEANQSGVHLRCL